jgi:amino acid permease
VFYELGFVLGSFSIIFGGAMSLFSGWLIAYGAHMTKGTCYEEIAMMSFGPKAQKFTCLCMICCNIGFTVSYIVLVR